MAQRTIGVHDGIGARLRRKVRKAKRIQIDGRMSDPAQVRRCDASPRTAVLPEPIEPVMISNDVVSADRRAIVPLGHRGRFFGSRHGGQKHVRELVAVALQELFHTLRLFRPDDQAGVVMFLHPVDDLRRIEGACIGLGRVGKAQHAASVVLGNAGEDIGFAAQVGYLDDAPTRATDSRPSTPAPGRQMNAPPTRRRNFEKVNLPVSMGLDVLGMGNAAVQAQAWRQAGVEAVSSFQSRLDRDPQCAW